ncbi:OST-HTH/LOTUS domain-containing protein, partial [Clostridium perfringens]|nr:OST-HTH/LOTUS domain-containing protein [Clostridium perfringens]
MAVGEDGWAHLGGIGTSLRTLDPAFDPRTFGYSQLIQLIKAHKELFTIRKEDEKGSSAVYVKRRSASRSRKPAPKKASAPKEAPAA